MVGLAAVAAALVGSYDALARGTTESGAPPAPAAECCSEADTGAASEHHASLAGDQPLTGHSVYHLNVEWVDHRGDSLRLGDFAGRPVIATMMFTRCFGTCPMLMQDVKRVYESLPADLQQEAIVVAVTFDHEYDTPEVLAEYAAYRRYNRPNWHFLHGSRSAIRELATLFGIRYTIDGDAIAHTDRIVVLDRSGRIVYTVDGILNPAHEITASLIPAIARSEQ